MATGIGVLRWMIFSTMPPMVSMPSESGVTSSSSVSEPTVSASACSAAPTATTSSGSMSASGSLPKKSATWRRTSGTRVEPPTRTTPSICSGVTCASASTSRQIADGALDQRLDQRLELVAARAYGWSGVSPASMTHEPVACVLRHSLARRADISAIFTSPVVSGSLAQALLALGEERLGDGVVEVVAAERRVAAGGQHLEDALLQAQQRDVEGAAAEVVDRVEALRALSRP